MMYLRKLLCWLGWHTALTVMTLEEDGAWTIKHRCIHCGGKQP